MIIGVRSRPLQGPLTLQRAKIQIKIGLTKRQPDFYLSDNRMVTSEYHRGQALLIGFYSVFFVRVQVLPETVESK